jgi:hypothetical protein
MQNLLLASIPDLLKFCWKRQGNIEKGNIQFSFVHLGFAFVV